MSDTEQVPGYTVPSFSAEGFDAHEVASQESTPEVIDGEYQEISPKRRKRNPSNRRVEEALYQRGIAEQQSTFLAQQALEKDRIIAEQQRQLQQYQQALHNTEEQRMQDFDTNLDTLEDSILQKMKRAKEDGDVDSEVQLNAELADIKAKKTTNEYAMYQKRLQNEQQARQIQEEPYEPIETFIPPVNHAPPVNEEFEDWRSVNQWYDTSPRLRQKADQYAAELSDTLAFNNMGHLIGTPEFMDSVSNMIREEYGIGQQEAQNANMDYEPQSYQQTPSYNVAAPTRRSSMADQYVNAPQPRNQTGPLRALSKEEFGIARHLQVKNRGEGEADLVRRYAQAKNYPKSNLPGGTPYRLTIV